MDYHLQTLTIVYKLGLSAKKMHEITGISESMFYNIVKGKKYYSFKENHYNCLISFLKEITPND